MENNLQVEKAGIPDVCGMSLLSFLIFKVKE